MNFKINSPATIANLGSGFDVLGMCLEGLSDSFLFSEAETFEIKVSGKDADLVPLEPTQNAIWIASNAYCKDQKLQETPYRVLVERQLPLSGGLGASAAASVAGALAGAIFAGHDLKASHTKKNMIKAALAGESAVAGRHLDNIAPCFLGGLTLVQDVEQCQVYSITLKADIWLTVATPRVKVLTKDARSVLKSTLPTERWTRQMSHCTTLALALALPDYEALKFGLIDPFAEPERSPFVPDFLKAKTMAMDLGALGFSLSGSGPSCFAVTRSKEIALNIENGLKNLWGPSILTHVCQPSLKGAQVSYV